jgi:DNA repair exonuclease SbcCD nuclease subunit
MKVYVTSDCHYGLKSAGIDRTEEIHAIMMRIVQDAIDDDADMFIHMGDLGHTANPSSLVHRYWVDLFNALQWARLKSRFILGNHDVVNRLGNTAGSLAPLERLGLKYVSAVTNFDSDHVGGWDLTYLPYVSKTTLAGQDRNKYYREKVKAYRSDDPTVVFTHLNIDGAKTDDDFLLRPVDAVMPKSLYQSDNVKLILSGHIHGPQTVRKSSPRHEIVGSPICTDFGDTSEKRYAVLGFKGSRVKVKFRPTNCIRLIELKYDLVGMPKPILPIPDTVDGAGVKVRIRCTEDQLALMDLQEFSYELQDRAVFVRPIVPTVLRDEVGKLEAKTIVKPGMSDVKMISNWINAKRPPHAKRIAELANEAIKEETDR